jgi:hypothetical protein
MVLGRTTTKDENGAASAYGEGAVVANEAVLLWRAVEPAYACGPDAQTHYRTRPSHSFRIYFGVVTVDSVRPHSLHL